MLLEIVSLLLSFGDISWMLIYSLSFIFFPLDHGSFGILALLILWLSMVRVRYLPLPFIISSALEIKRCLGFSFLLLKLFLIDSGLFSKSSRIIP